MEKSEIILELNNQREKAKGLFGRKYRKKVKMYIDIISVLVIAHHTSVLSVFFYLTETGLYKSGETHKILFSAAAIDLIEEVDYE